MVFFIWSRKSEGKVKINRITFCCLSSLQFEYNFFIIWCRSAAQQLLFILDIYSQCIFSVSCCLIFIIIFLCLHKHIFPLDRYAMMSPECTTEKDASFYSKTAEKNFRKNYFFLKQSIFERDRECALIKKSSLHEQDEWNQGSYQELNIMIRRRRHRAIWSYHISETHSVTSYKFIISHQYALCNDWTSEWIGIHTNGHWKHSTQRKWRKKIDFYLFFTSRSNLTFICSVRQCSDGRFYVSL